MEASVSDMEDAASRRKPPSRWKCVYPTGKSFSNKMDVRVLIQRDVSAYPTSNSCWFSALFLIISTVLAHTRQHYDGTLEYDGKYILWWKGETLDTVLTYDEANEFYRFIPWEKEAQRVEKKYFKKLKQKMKPYEWR